MGTIRSLLACALAVWLGCAAQPLDAAVIVQLRVVEGEGAIYPTGSRAARGITVQVTDETGSPVSGASVSFRLPDQGPSGTFNGGLRTEVVTTQADGRASIWGMQWNKTAGPFEIRITAMKDQARAGIVSSQFLSDTAVVRPSAGAIGTFQPTHHYFNKWVILIAVAGAAGAGLAFGTSHSSAALAAPPVAAPQIGNPTILIKVHP